MQTNKNLTLEELQQENERLKSIVEKGGLIWNDYPEENENKEYVITLNKELSLLTEESVDNKIIEGDNLLALRELQKTHKNKIDVIYIDPPYNTGNEFVYNDKIVDKEDIFRHSKWLSFMDKRLRLAKNLMTDDGVIFISIDDNEQAQLKLLMDEIFGEENFKNTIIWHYGKMSNEKNKFANNHEYVHIYGKSELSKLIPNVKKEDTEYKNRWINYVTNNKIYYGDVKHKSDAMIKNRIKSIQRELNLKELPENTVLYDFDKEYKVDSDVIYVPIIKGNSMEKVAEFGLGQKPLNLLNRLLSSVLKYKKDAIVLDFFAGSGTTGHAVMELNKEDGGNRSFILCTNNEVSEEKVRQHFISKGLLDKNTKTAFKKFYKENKELVEAFYQSKEYEQLGIARSVTRERIKRVSEGYITPKGDKIEGLGGGFEYYIVE